MRVLLGIALVCPSVRGTLKSGTFNGSAVPIITPTEIEPIDTPDQPYLYS